MHVIHIHTYRQNAHQTNLMKTFEIKRMSCLYTKYRKPSKNTLENTTIPIANVGGFFFR